MLDPDRSFSLGLSWTGPSVILNSETEFIMIALIGFSSPCFSLVSCVSKTRKENTHHKTHFDLRKDTCRKIHILHFERIKSYEMEQNIIEQDYFENE